MSSAVAHADEEPQRARHAEGPASAARGHGEGGPADRRIIVGYGFWIFLLSDVIMFASLFASFAVLSNATGGGPSGKELFDLRTVAVETGCLLASSFVCGMASLAVQQRSQKWTQIALLCTGLLGLIFILLEVHEFARLVARGAGPTRSAFLSSFFTLVGCHGLHVTAGLLWLGTMMAQFWAKGFRQTIRYRFLCFSLFWHALDIIWVAIFSLVYLVGVSTLSKQNEHTGPSEDMDDVAPGDEPGAAGDLGKAVRGYLLGLALAVALTAASFWTVSTHLIYAPGVPVAVLVLAIAQMGIHLAFFLHITTSPDNTNNVLALAFGVLICCLVVFGSLWIMANLAHNMMPMSEMLKMQR